MSDKLYSSSNANYRKSLISKLNINWNRYRFSCSLWHCRKLVQFLISFGAQASGPCTSLIIITLSITFPPCMKKQQIVKNHSRSLAVSLLRKFYTTCFSNCCFFLWHFHLLLTSAVIVQLMNFVNFQQSRKNPPNLIQAPNTAPTPLSDSMLLSLSC